MAFKRITEMDIYEIMTRWYAGYNTSRLSTTSGLDRKTVRHYIHQAKQAGISRAQPFPERDVLVTLFASFLPTRDYAQPARTTFAPYKEEIVSLITGNYRKNVQRGKRPEHPAL
ncbi:MAG: hypothetical protein ACE5IR_10745 [bacterium]